MNIQEVHAEVRSKWLAEEAPRRSLRERIALVVPYGIGIVGGGLYLLSAPHTAQVFDALTPGYGWVAPAVVEFSLIYAAFRHKVSDTMPPFLNFLQWLMFATAVLVNAAGAFSAVVAANGLSGMSFTVIMANFGSLPAITQVQLVMSGLAGLIVPVGAIAAGEGIAHLVLQRQGDDFLETRWHEVEREVLYRAVFSRLNGDGLPAREAARIAQSEVRAFLAPIDPGRMLSLPPGVGAPQQTPAEQSLGAAQGVLSTTLSTVDRVVDGSRQRHAKKDTVSDVIRTFLVTNPGSASLSISDLHDLLASNGVDASRALVARVLREARGASQESADETE